VDQGQIIACAVIGREDDVLVVRRSGGRWALPRTRVEPGEWVEDALGRGVREVLGVGMSSATFLCLVEDPDGLFLIFDVTPEAGGNLCTSADQPELAWGGLDQLTSLDLRPAVLRDVLPVGDPPAWLPHQDT
jgi:ADP-ribose pyrophosphatase YjhB (NUDIX family)